MSLRRVPDGDISQFACFRIAPGIAREIIAARYAPVMFRRALPVLPFGIFYAPRRPSLVVDHSPMSL